LKEGFICLDFTTQCLGDEEPLEGETGDGHASCLHLSHDSTNILGIPSIGAGLYGAPQAVFGEGDVAFGGVLDEEHGFHPLVPTGTAGQKDGVGLGRGTEEGLGGLLGVGTVAAATAAAAIAAAAAVGCLFGGGGGGSGGLGGWGKRLNDILEEPPGPFEPPRFTVGVQQLVDQVDRTDSFW
jgi:hypothetical protein